MENAHFGALLVFGAALVSTYWVMPHIIRKLSHANIVGRDVNKKERPKVPEMGGLGIVVGFISGILIAVGLYTFFGLGVDLTRVLIGMVTVLIMAFIGIFDDLFDMGQRVKAVLPVLAALPLIAIQAGDTVMFVPLLGPIDFGILYLIILVPLGVTVSSNLTNMLAGFNGLESGLGILMTGTIAIIALTQIGIYDYSLDALVISSAMCGALVGFTRFNWFPARVFPGDVGTLIIGAALSSAVIMGNMESAGAILVIPYVIDFFMKMKHGFPKTFGIVGATGRLCCPKTGPMGLGQYIMKKTGGVSEVNLVMAILSIELLLSLVVISLFGVF
ncbi:MAG: hypothetical protein ABIG39_03880 [Candidatus Micrarchaeota archaeon]